MVNVGKDIVKSIDAVDMVLGTLAKPMVERIATPVVGNGTVMSGALKIAAAFGVAKYGGNNRIGKAAAIGAAMDGSEDLVLGLGSKVGLSGAAQTSAGVF